MSKVWGKEFSISKLLENKNYSAAFSFSNNKHRFTKNLLSIEIQEYNPVYRVGSHYYRFKSLPWYTKEEGLSVNSNEKFLFLEILNSYSNLTKKKKKKQNNESLSTVNPNQSKAKIQNTSLITGVSSPFLSLDNPNQSKINVIFLDAGHGGHDSGAVSYGFKEKDLALQTSKELEKILKKNASKIKVVLIRKKDKYLSLEERCHMANSMLKQNENGIFISIHLNFWFDSETSGFESYYLSHQDKSVDARIVSLVKNENFDYGKADLNTLSEFEQIFGRLEVIQYQKESQLMANYIANNVNKQFNEYNQNRGVKSDLFYVLKGAIMPAVLIELGFISNKKDIEILSDKKKRKPLLLSIAEGLIEYIKIFNQTDGFRKHLLE